MRMRERKTKAITNTTMSKPLEKPPIYVSTG